MKNKYYWFAVAAAFLAMGICAIGLVSTLGEEYFGSQMALGRPQEEMMSLLGWQMIGYLIITIVFVYIYSKGRQGGSWQEGARYGAVIGVMMCGISLYNYTVYPWALSTLYADMFVNMVVYSIGGIVTALVYKSN